MYPFISIQNINKLITSNYYTQPKNNDKEDVSVPIHLVQIPNNIEYHQQKRKWYSQLIYIYISFLNEGLYRHIHVSKICYAYFLLIKAVPQYYPQNDDDVSCVTGVTGITGPSLTTQYRRSDITEFFVNVVEEATTDSKRKRSVAALSHLQYYTDASKHDPIKW